MTTTQNSLFSKKSEVIFATATQQKDIKKTLLYESLVQHNLEGQLYGITSNKVGLCAVYNDILKKIKESGPQNYPDVLVLCHDDIVIDSVKFVDTLKDHFLLDRASVVGVAGTFSFKIQSPALWHLMSSNKESMSGCVSHFYTRDGITKHAPTFFGEFPSRVILLDGVFLAINVRDIFEKDIWFDENIEGFHHYDLKFCHDVHQAGLKLMTTDVHIIHSSPGLQERTKSFVKSEKYFLEELSKAYANK
jgi:hypothetical protein